MNIYTENIDNIHDNIYNSCINIKFWRNLYE